MLTYTGHSIDRAIISTVMPAIQQEFSLSDSQLGLIAGTIYAIANALCTIPIGYLADRTNRKNLLSFCAFIWSGMTVLGGVAGSYVGIVLTRAGVGGAEAAGTPVGTSLISDYFPPEKRASAISMFYVSASLGAFLALAVGGWIVAEYGWRAAMIAAGIPGMILAVISFFVIREPRRTGLPANAKDAPTLLETMKFIFTQKSLMPLMFGGIAVNFVSSATGGWMPTYYVRSFGLSMAEIGPLLGTVKLFIGGAGGVLAGFLCDRLVRRDRRWPVWILAITQFTCVPLLLCSLLVSDHMLSVFLYGLSYGLGMTFTGPLYSSVQSLVGTRMRATAVALLVMGISLLGFGFGAQATGLVSDMLKDNYGTESLRYAIMVLSLVNVLTATLFIISSRKFMQAQDRVAAMAARA
ncbi:spinster family MFS transporter, partial [Arvimicrobium flavum]|uniref:spinster family MFS transporter n=1 Tax=Arvimicrobium flavum TaxID=3393320 RepID=UPI00237B3736